MPKRLSVATLALALAACGAGGAADGGDAPDDVGKFEQTWTTAYAETTCAHWQQDMDAHQRFVMAADMLISARSNDGDDSIPADGMIDRFVGEIGTACDGPGEDIGVRVPEIAAGIYTVDAETYAP